MSELVDETVEFGSLELNSKEYDYVFTFVGIIVVAGRILKCYPKYLFNVEDPVIELRKIYKVIENIIQKNSL